MKFKNIPFAPPDMSEAEVELVAEALRSGWITTGPKTKEFESQIAAYVGTRKAVCLNSCTAAMEMALRLVGVGPDDEVIIPAYTYTATASVVDHVGCKLVMVDSQKDKVEMDYDQLADAITEHTKVICPVDLGGVMCDYDRIFEIVEAKKHLFRPTNEIQRRIGRVVIAADDAHGLGATWHGKTAGSIADFTSFSFHAVKNLTTARRRTTSRQCRGAKGRPGTRCSTAFRSCCRFTGRTKMRWPRHNWARGSTTSSGPGTNAT